MKRSQRFIPDPGELFLHLQAGSDGKISDKKKD